MEKNWNQDLRKNAPAALRRLAVQLRTVCAGALPLGRFCVSPGNVRKIILPLLMTLVLGACGGGGGDGTPVPPTAPNVVPISVDGLVFGSTNAPFVSVTLCSPANPGACTTIDHILVDTGSTGLRVFAQPQNSVALASLNLAPQTISGQPVGECLPFAAGVTWGSIKLANVQIGGETASNAAIQVISDPTFNSVPAACSNQGAVMSTPASFGANGVLGVGISPTDCSVCTIVPSNIYFSCGLNCNAVAMPLANQVQNPTKLFAQNNNGVIITLNPVPSGGAEYATGTLTFGVDTAANNASTNANVIKVDNNGNFSTVFDGQTYGSSFIDSGSNGYFFDTIDPAFVHCGNNALGFYCPINPIALSAVITGGPQSTAPAAVTVNVVDPTTLFSSQNFAFNDLAGQAVSLPGTFDFGLPFFYGKSVYVVMAGSSSTKGSGPYVGW